MTSQPIECGKHEQIRALLDLLSAEGRPVARVCEFGRLRKPNEEGRLGDGWSTYHFVLNPAVRLLLSIDPSIDTRRACEQVIPQPERDKIIYAAGCDRETLQQCGPFDLLYIDADDSPEQNLGCLFAALPFLTRAAVIAVDDWHVGLKPRLIREFLAATHSRTVIGDLVAFRSRPERSAADRSPCHSDLRACRAIPQSEVGADPASTATVPGPG